MFRRILEMFPEPNPGESLQPGCLTPMPQREGWQRPRGSCRSFEEGELDVTERHGVAERIDLVWPRRNELLSDIAFIAGLQDCSHDGRIIDLLVLIDFASARTAGGVVMTDDIFESMQATDDISVHDLNVVDIEEKLHVW